MIKKQKKRQQLLIFGMGVAAIITFVVLGLRFSYIMVTGSVKGIDLRARAAELSTRSSIVAASRGSIVDRDGEPVALDATSYALSAVLTDEWSVPGGKPNYVQEDQKADLANLLSLVLDQDKEDILKQLNKKNQKEVQFGSKSQSLTIQEKERIEKEGFTGLVFKEQPARLYPNSIYASHLIGYTQREDKSATDDATDTTDASEDQSLLTGAMGVETLFNDQLSGTNGQYTVEVDGNGLEIPQTRRMVTQPHDGQSIQLTLDSSLQQSLEAVMSEVYEKYAPKTMQAVLADPETGEILAVSQRPTFNLNTLSGIDDSWQNLFYENAYEPGSTMKVLALAAAINEGVFDPTATYESGTVKIYDDTIHDYNKVGWGTISYLDGVARSSNVLFVKLITAMGEEKWHDYLNAFHINQKTNSGFSNEATGSNPFDSQLQKVSTGFGQGISTTAAQMMQAFITIANDGEMRPLHFYNATLSANGKELKKETNDVIANPITSDSAKKTLEYLKEVVYNEQGTGQIYEIPGVQLAAKTGTAEMVDPETGQYYKEGDSYIYSVVGFAPADDPKYVAYVTVEQPQKNPDGQSGSEIVAQVFKPLLTRALKSGGYLDEETQTSGTLPNLVGQDLKTAEKTLKDLGITQMKAIGSGSTVTAQYPSAGASLFPGNRGFILTEGDASVPDMTGWSKQDVTHLADLIGVTITSHGQGFVTEQNIPAGRPITQGDVWNITFELKEED